jgi:predicted secreted protein
MMNPVSGFVLFAFVWFLTLLVVLPLRLKTQGDVGQVVNGTPESAPANLNLKRKMITTTIAAACIWAVLAYVIISGFVTVQALDDLTHRMVYGAP